MPNAFFEPLGAPVVDDIAPRLAAEGESIVLLGSNFGDARSDVRQVTIGGEPCKEIGHRGRSVLTCTMPAPTAELQYQVDQGNLLALANLSVQVTTIGDQSSSVSIGSYVSYPTAGAIIGIAPGHVVGWRERGRPDRLVMRWTFPEQDWTTLGYSPPTDFEFEIVHVAANESDLTQMLRIRIGDASAVKTAESISVMRMSLPVVGDTPLQVRIRVICDAGNGPWSNYTQAIPSSCAANQFLSSHLPISEWTCVDCLPHSMLCDGGPAQLVQAQPGYRRMGWKSGFLAFARCPGANACLL